jgi:hypothetical protein
MRHDDIEELKLLISHNLDVIDFLDLIDVSLEDLVELLEDKIEDNYERLHTACK